MTKKLNVLMVTAMPLDDPAGGVTTMIRTLAGFLAPDCGVVLLENRWEVARLTRLPTTGIARYEMQLRSPYVRGRALRGAVGWLATFPWNFAALRRMVQRESIDVIHLHYGAPYHYMFNWLRRLDHIPYVTTLHRGDIMTFRDLAWPDRMLMRNGIRGANRVVSVSRWLAGEAVKTIGPLPALEVIENGLDFDEIDAMIDPQFGSALGFALPPRFFLMVSNLAAYKAPDVAIRAWARVHARHPDVPLLIVGQERDFGPECLRLIQELNCSDAVRLVGAQPRAVAINLMRRAAGLLLPSRSEGLPYVLLEAGALGTPVVCSDIGPFKEVVADGKTALIAPVEDDAALAAAAIRAIDDPEAARAMGMALSRHVRSAFSVRRMGERYLDLYRRVQSGAAGSSA